MAPSIHSEVTQKKMKKWGCLGGHRVEDDKMVVVTATQCEHLRLGKGPKVCSFPYLGYESDVAGSRIVDLKSCPLIHN